MKQVATSISVPDAAELEVSVFSKGYGEAIAVHLGGGKWILIDSHEDANGDPVTLSYLRSLGVDPSSDVLAVLLTHWHDDHIAGAAKLIAACPNAVVALSGFLQKDEFRSFLSDRGAPEAGSFGSGLSELESVLSVMAKTRQRRKWCWAEKNIVVDHGENGFFVQALSPSEKDFETFIASISAVASGNGRLGAPRRNNSSVAAVVASMSELILLGADLENGPLGSGWMAVHQAVWQNRGKASFYKIAHHGSAGAHYDPVWLDMLTEGVTAALTPWNRSSKLPTQGDVDRISALTDNAFAAAKPRAVKKPKRLNAVERSLRESDIKIVPGDVAQGHLQFRKKAGAAWQIEMSGAACHIADVLAA